MPSILFLCLGNICRSPTAEGIMRVRAREAGVEIVLDSAGTGNWHDGKAPDPRAIAEAATRGTPIDDLRARQITYEDFYRFDHIIAMDRSNMEDARRLQPDDATAAVSLLFDHVPGREGEPVADPWYGDESDFTRCWQDCDAGVRGLLMALGKG